MTIFGCVDDSRHDWRLIEELPVTTMRRRDAAGIVLEVMPKRTRWYCTRCRLIETLEEDS